MRWALVLAIAAAGCTAQPRVTVAPHPPPAPASPDSALGGLIPADTLASPVSPAPPAAPEPVLTAEEALASEGHGLLACSSYSVAGAPVPVRVIAARSLGGARYSASLGAMNGLDADARLAPDDAIAFPPPDTLAAWRKIAAKGDTALRSGAEARLHEAVVAYDRGTFLAREGRHEEALPYFEQAIALAPGMPDLRYNAGISLRALDRRGEAASQFGLAAALRPGRALYRYAHGASLAAAGHPGGAENELRAALQRQSDYLEARFALARLLEDLGRAADALREWQAYLRDDERSPWADEARRRIAALSVP